MPRKEHCKGSGSTACKQRQGRTYLDPHVELAEVGGALGRLQTVRRDLQLLHRRDGKTLFDDVTQEPAIDLPKSQAAKVGRRSDPGDEGRQDFCRAEEAFDGERVKSAAEGGRERLWAKRGQGLAASLRQNEKEANLVGEEMGVTPRRQVCP